MRGEFWLPVTGYEDFYEVSNIGRVRSRPRIVRARSGGLRYYEGKILTPTMNGGYLKVSLCVNRKSDVRLVHLLVLEAFVGPRPGHPRKWHGCHNNGDVTQNHVGNLRWDTVSANALDAVKHGTAPKGEERHDSKLTEADVVEIRKRLSDETISSIARCYGVDRKTIRKIRDGETWKWLAPENPTLHRKAKRATA